MLLRPDDRRPRRVRFVVRQRCGVGPNGYAPWEGLPARINLGTDPLTVHAVPIVEKAVPFHQPGQYEFILVRYGTELSPPFYLEVRG